MRNIVLTALGLLTSIIYCAAQNKIIREKFLAQEEEQIKKKYPSYLPIKVSGTRLLWDTTSSVFRSFLTRSDTTDKSNIDVLASSARRKMITLQKMLDDRDYSELKEQIKNQQRDDFPMERVLTNDSKRKLKKKHFMSMSFSQPLVVANGSLIFLTTEMKSEGGYSLTRTCHKRVGDHWEQFLIVETRAVFR